VCNSTDALEIAREAKEVHGHDGKRTGGYSLTERGRLEVERVW
jgi:hypothetical protein